MHFDSRPYNRRKNARKGKGNRKEKGNRDKLPLPARNVLEALMQLACTELVCRESVNAVVNRAGHCTRTVNKYLDELEDLSYIERLPLRNGGYVICIVSRNLPK